MTTLDTKKLRIVCISDTHNHGNGEGFKLPAGDVLVHAGDITNQGDLREFQRAARWLGEADFGTKIIVAGNHDLSLDPSYDPSRDTGWSVTASDQERCRAIVAGIPNVIYLQHESCTVSIGGRSLKVFGSPYSIDTGKQNWAFQYQPLDANSIWSSIPADTDIIVTHSPPAGVLDESTHWPAGGCPSLLRQVSVIQPILHVFGHHHEGRGAVIADWSTSAEGQPFTATSWHDPGADNRKQSILDLATTENSSQHRTAFINASIMKTSWSKSRIKEFNKPIIVTLGADQLVHL